MSVVRTKPLTLSHPPLHAPSPSLFLSLHQPSPSLSPSGPISISIPISPSPSRAPPHSPSPIPGTDKGDTQCFMTLYTPSLTSFTIPIPIPITMTCVEGVFDMLPNLLNNAWRHHIFVVVLQQFVGVFRENIHLEIHQVALFFRR